MSGRKPRSAKPNKFSLLAGSSLAILDQIPDIDRKKATAKADLWFSRFIRLRDSRDGMYGPCITCRGEHAIKAMDCGHFVKRQHLATRWSEKNCALQCKGCNAFEQGAELLHAEEIDRRHGKGTADLLRFLAKKGQAPDTQTIRQLAEHYEKETRKLMERYGVRW